MLAAWTLPGRGEQARPRSIRRSGERGRNYAGRIDYGLLGGALAVTMIRALDGYLLHAGSVA